MADVRIDIVTKTLKSNKFNLIRYLKKHELKTTIWSSNSII